ncbi:MAG: family 78 glycoside hydrolase catalytic domain [Clostridia bacterium]|nr:family 78 glycoside hydrolase catalytic domain [Clostridia bacterium]
MNKNFIKAGNERCSFEKHVSAPYFRRSFMLDFVPDTAEISVCGLGFYLLYINGVEITKGELAPYISNPDDYCYYDSYDLKKYLKKGENVIGIVLGNGFMNCFGGSVWDFDKADWTGVPRVAVSFFAQSGDMRLEFIADSEFKVSSSPITFDELRMGEFYDARLEQPGWNEPGFDDSGWESAASCEAPRGELCLCRADPIKVIKELKPQKITEQDGGYLYDFGENSAGVCRLKIKAEPGQRIIMQHGEILTGGSFDNSNINYEEEWGDYIQKDIYTAKGEGTEVYTPRFTYHGFRYVFVSGITPSQATEDLLTYCVMSSDLKEIGGFHCSDETVNTLFEMVQRADRSNFYYFPTDCPHREKNGWTGDASMSADQMIMMYDADVSWRVWLDNIRKSQSDEGILPGIVPTGGWGFAWGNGPAWDSVLFNLPYMLYRYRGDTEVIRENSHAMLRYLEYILKRRSADGTVAIGLGDWVPVGKPSKDYDAPLALTDSIMVMDMAKKAAEMFNAVGYTHNARYAEGIYRDMRDTIRRVLIDKSTMLASGNCQTSQAMSLYYGVFEESEEKEAFVRLIELIHAKGDNFDCGFLGMHVLFHVLSKFGESELAFHMITKKEYPSYACLIDRGETAMVEQFVPEKDIPEGVISSSHNHHFLADISRWFMCELAGLYIVNSQEVEIRPKFIEKIDFASAYYDLPKGRAEVSWKRTADGIKLDVNCCDGVVCNIVLENGYSMQNGIVVKTNK